MSTLEIMRDVRAAEEKAEDVRKDAAAEAREIVKAAEAASVQKERAAAQNVRARVAAFHKEEDAKVDREIEKQGVTMRARLENERRDAQVFVDKAAQFLFERIVSHGDR